MISSSFRLSLRAGKLSSLVTQGVGIELSENVSEPGRFRLAMGLLGFVEAGRVLAIKFLPLAVPRTFSTNFLLSIGLFASSAFLKNKAGFTIGSNGFFFLSLTYIPHTLP
jgi:hypothetical protein